MNIGRLKFEIDPLVNEILDHIPEKHFISDADTFCDPEMGGGQFVKEVEKRLRSYGHSDENISKRVYGFASSIVQLNYVVNKYKLLGQYSIFNIMENSLGKKFDVVIGNPPFQSPSKNKKINRGATSNLYQKFIEKSCNLVKNDSSIIALVTPPGFLKSTDWEKPNKYFDMINKRGISYIKLEGVKKHFNVTNPFCYFISTKSKNITIDSKETITIKNDDLFFIPSSLDKQTLSIFNKVAYCDNGINMKFKRLNEKPNNKYVAIKPMNNRLWGVKAQLNLEKLALGNDLIWEHEKSENIVKILNSKTFSYLIRRTQYDAIIYFKFFNGFRIPKNLDKQWTDEELYRFYDFTKNEINSIETFGEYYLK